MPIRSPLWAGARHALGRPANTGVLAATGGPKDAECELPAGDGPEVPRGDGPIDRGARMSARLGEKDVGGRAVGTAYPVLAVECAQRAADAHRRPLGRRRRPHGQASRHRGH